MSARIVLLGPPGAGKGTQAVRISQALAVPAVSTGDLFRSNIKGQTELGKLAQSYSDRGELVPDSVTSDMVLARLKEADAANGYLLDGYPRNAAQVARLDEIAAELGAPVTGAIEITADADIVAERLIKRAEIEGRVDDTAEVIRRRLEVYEEQTAPISALYAERGQLVTVDGIGEIDEVTERIMAALGALTAG